MERSVDEIRLLLRSLMFFEPEAEVIHRVTDVRAIWEWRHELKQLSYHPAVLSHLARLVRTTLAENRRFRVLDCVKVLRAQVVASEGLKLPSRVVRDLFAIYCQLILASREELQWALSRLIRDQELTDEEVAWLIEHWRESHHLVNRLLRYPVPHSEVSAWARQCYTAGLLSDRKSELLAILILEDGIKAFAQEDPVILAWALVRVALPLEQKLDYLEALEPRLPGELIVDISCRLGDPRLIHRALA
jgi:hypothetical protein